MYVSPPPPGYCLEPGEELREYMRRSLFLAKARGGLEAGRLLATVGDYTSRRALREGLRPKLIVVDCMVERRSAACLEAPSGYRVVEARNPRGCISWEAWLAVSSAWRSDTPVMIRVHGEEDLVAIPVIIEAPEDAIVAYGVPWEGLVVVEASWAKPLAEYIARCSRLRLVE